MPTVQRYDRSSIRAKRTDEGYLVDRPIVGRVGIQIYRDAAGNIRRELRPEDEVFKADSLATFSGKPITNGHPATAVDASNAKALSIGVMQSAAERDNNDVAVPIVIHDAAAVAEVDARTKTELSLGYTVDLDETPGEWNGQRYDAVQRNIRINHLALVPKGRAGNARLNLDRCDAVEITEEESHMPDIKLGRVRLDNGLEYDAAQEVVIAMDKLRADAATAASAAQVKHDALVKANETLCAERDTLKAEVAKIPQIKLDAVKEASAAATARAALEKTAAEFKVDCAGLTDRQVREAVILSVRTDADLKDRSDEYVAASFDTTVSMRADHAIVSQRLAVSGARADDDGKREDAAASYENFMANLSNPAAKE